MPENPDATDGPRIRFVAEIPDLIHPEEYEALGDRKVVRMRIETGPEGLVVIADSRHADLLDQLLPRLTQGEVEERLCG